MLPGRASKNVKAEINVLAVKITRLRKKLLSYGWSGLEVKTLIMTQFLKLPQIDWGKPSCTSHYFQIRDRYNVDSCTAEMLMCLQKIVPNLQVKEVSDYLLRVLQYNSFAFGFDLSDSSSDSSQQFTSYKLARKQQKKKNTQKSAKRMNQYEGEDTIRKRHHLTQDQQQQQQFKIEIRQRTCSQKSQPETGKQNWKKRPPAQIPEIQQKPEKRLKKE